jgi:hypothetical protein
MNRIYKIIVVSLLVLMMPAVFASGQDKKTEQRIKIIVAEDGGPKVLIDTLITGDSPKDSLILKEGKTIYLTRAESDDSDKQSTHENGKCKKAHCEELVSGGKYTCTIVSDSKESDSEKAKYIISRDGLRITVEGSDYDKVKEITRDIEKTFDDRNKTKEVNTEVK